MKDNPGKFLCVNDMGYFIGWDFHNCAPCIVCKKPVKDFDFCITKFQPSTLFAKIHYSCLSGDDLMKIKKWQILELLEK